MSGTRMECSLTLKEEKGQSEGVNEPNDPKFESEGVKEVKRRS